MTNFGETPAIDVYGQGYMGALVSFLLISKCFDWLRIFEKSSFYIKLINSTIEDIGWFMVLFLVSLIMFAFPLNVLNNIND